MRRVYLSLLPILLAACGGEPESPQAQAETAALAKMRVTPRTSDPALIELRALLGGGHALEPARVDALLRRCRQADSFEADLLEARWAGARGEDSRSSQLIEKAREARPDDARVYATASEIHAAAGRLETSDLEITRGVQACGVTAELERAKGIGLIVRPGGGRIGLEVLERARRKDPELPFMARPLGQAYLLAGMRCLSEQKPEEAQAYAKKALAEDPEDVEVRRFLVECEAALGNFEACLQGYRALVADGVPLQGELALTLKRAGMAALIDGNQELALARLREARNAGLDPEELGSAAGILRAAAQEKVAAAREAYDAGEIDRAEDLAIQALEYDPEYRAARSELARCAVYRGLEALQVGNAAEAVGILAAAIEQDPDSLEGHQFLGHALYELERYGEAAAAWQWVVDTARIEKLELPDPVAIQLATALKQDGRMEEARSVLEEELHLSPAGPFADEVRAYLASLNDTGGR